MNFVLLLSTVLAAGENCASSSKSLWENHYCSIVANPAKFQSLCTPVRTFPNIVTNFASLPANSVKGVVMMYHGYTACPDQMNIVAASLQAEGYITYQPLTQGHGLKLGFNCGSPSVCVGSLNVNPTELPTNKDQYKAWVKSTVDILNQEIAFIPAAAKAPGFSVTAFGLSLGGPLSLYAAEIAGSPVTHVLNINSYLTTAFPPLDFKVANCDSEANPTACISNLLTNAIAGKLQIPTVSAPGSNGVSGNNTLMLEAVKVASNILALGVSTVGYNNFLSSAQNILATLGDSPFLLSNNFFEKPFGWGARCYDQTNAGRGGYCDFYIRNLIVLQSFGQYVVGNLDNIKNTVKYGFINSDVDGPVRDSIADGVVQHLKSRGLNSSRCHYPLMCTVSQMANQPAGLPNCGVPHACLSKVELLGSPMFWETDLITNIKSFITTSNPIGSATGNGAGVCVQQPSTLNFNANFNSLGKQFYDASASKYKGK